MTRTQRRELAAVREKAKEIGIKVNVRRLYDSDAWTAPQVVGAPGAIVIFGVHTSRDHATQETIGPPTDAGILGRAGIITVDDNKRYQVADRPPTMAELVVVMGCDSAESRDAFEGAKNYIGVNGGADNGSSSYRLNQGIIETVKTIVNANGIVNQKTLDSIVTNTQKVIRSNEAQKNPDQDDTVILNPSIRLPTPGRRVP